MSDDVAYIEPMKHKKSLRARLRKRNSSKPGKPSSQNIKDSPVFLNIYVCEGACF